MNAIKRLHTRAVDAAFAPHPSATDAEKALLEARCDHVREIAGDLDAEIQKEEEARAIIARLCNRKDPRYEYQDELLFRARTSQARAAAYERALEFAVKSHGRFSAYVDAKQAIWACEVLSPDADERSPEIAR